MEEIDGHMQASKPEGAMYSSWNCLETNVRG